MVKVNANLKRSRHGVYYYRAVIPKELKAKFGLAEIKRSLGTKDPKQAKSMSLAIQALIKVYGFDFLKMLTLKSRTLDELENMIKNFPDFNFTHIAKMMVRDQCSGLELFADPSIPGDKELLLAVLGELKSNPKFNSLQTSNLAPRLENSLKISQVIPAWLDFIKDDIQSSKTVDEYKSKILIFKDFVKDIPVDQINKRMVAEFIQKLKSGEITKNKLKPNTVNKYVIVIKSFLDQASRMGAWHEDKAFPTIGQKVRVKRQKQTTTYSPFTKEELLQIFSSDNLLSWKKLGGGDHRPHMTWLPIIALFTGARLEEIIQLQLSDIYLDESDDIDGVFHKVWVIDINDNDRKTLKNVSSIRKIPLHPLLIEIGFLDYIKDIRSNFPLEKNIFPYLIANKYDKMGDSVSKWFGRYLDRLNIKDNKKVFHSFRSTANNKLKTSGVDEETRCQMVGHAYDSVNSYIYSDKHKPKWLLENVIPKLQFSYLDFGSLKYKKDSYVPVLQKLIRKRDSEIKHRLRNK